MPAIVRKSMVSMFLVLLVSVEGGRLFQERRGKKVKASRSTCGTKGEGAPAGPNVSIVNGQLATECEWKWQVGLWRELLPGSGEPWGDMPFCGGMLINPEWVLSAAHCVSRPNFIVIAGDYEPKLKSGNEQTRSAVQVIRHPNYDTRRLNNDFVLIRLNAKVDFNDCVGSVCLPSEGADVAPKSQCWITGWGTLSRGGQQPDKLQEAQVSIISNEDCTGKYNYTEEEISSAMLCAQGKSSNGSIVDACQGDSGGPLVCESNGQWTLFGATSWGYGCAAEAFPGVWSRIHEAVGWIDEMLETHVGPPPARPRCPDFAMSPEPDDDGDCQCKSDKYCSTNGADRNCPTSGELGGYGGTYFSPNCADCKCILEVRK